MNTTSLILGIESSCDETAASIVRNGKDILSNVIASQEALHVAYGGVVPELASRAHVKRILPVIREATHRAGTTLNELDAIAVGNRPGLIGSLVVAVAAAKALAWSLNKPLIGIDHVHAHLYAGFLENDSPREKSFPALSLVVSGGHTAIYNCPDPSTTDRIGTTIDDAIGEAYDKAASTLGLSYPGGPKLDKLAQQGNPRAHDFPISRLGADSLDFSFSGLKTAVLYTARGNPTRKEGKTTFPRNPEDLTEEQIKDIAASFQRAAVAAIILKLKRALAQTKDVRALLVGGGVSANSHLRASLQRLAQDHNLQLLLPDMPFCMDNAAMIAGAAHARFVSSDFDDLSLRASPTGAR